jgi:RNA polymerase sigma factor (sigma-70 family)
LLNSSLHIEQQLLSDLAKGTHKATTAIYKQHHKVVVSWIVNHGGDAADAEDVFQEAMVVLYQKAQSEDFRLTCKIGTYLFAISKHLWYKKLEQQQRGPSLLDDNMGSDDGRDLAYEDDVKAHEEREAHYEQLNGALDRLGEPCSSLLKAFYHHDKSMQEIAAMFGYTNPDNAKTQKYKCLNRLKKIFYGQGMK